MRSAGAVFFCPNGQNFLLQKPSEAFRDRKKAPEGWVDLGMALCFNDSMTYTEQYSSPLGTITIACDDEAIVGLWFNGLWFNGQKHFGNTLIGAVEVREKDQKHPLLEEAVKWLDIYFSGQEPSFLPPLRYDSTRFRKRVCDIMLTIPYGKTMTYGEIANIIAKELGIKKMSAQAVGGAVGQNPISLMIPCHRVVGANGSLTGYGGGLNRKVKLLALEKVDMSKLYNPSNETNNRTQQNVK